MKKIIHIVGARPNFMKAAPVMAALDSHARVNQLLVHTGQHYDANMSRIFFQQLGLPEPDLNLEVGSGSHAQQTARIMINFEEVVLRERPDRLVVYGDINSTLATSLVAAKLHIPVAHVEAGLRARDPRMPEEINRLLTDRLADLLFTPSEDGDANLLAEGIPAERIHRVGNVMIDTLARLLPQARLPKCDGLAERYALVTLHRPSNVDQAEMLNSIVATLRRIGRDLQVVFPIHPRTRQRATDLGIDLTETDGFRLLEPLGYLEFLALQRDATAVITDSGGIQEETTWLGVPCLTVRENTERPITLTQGTNLLVGTDMDLLQSKVGQILDGRAKQGGIPELWDGLAGKRIAAILAQA